jgi:hypothetical protein
MNIYVPMWLVWTAAVVIGAPIAAGLIQGVLEVIGEMLHGRQLNREQREWDKRLAKLDERAAARRGALSPAQKP